MATVLHPDFTYGRNFTNDVALLHLSRPVPFPTVKLETRPSASLAPGGCMGCAERLLTNYAVHAAASVAWTVGRGLGPPLLVLKDALAACSTRL